MQTTLFTTAQAAERLGISVPTLNRWVRHGRVQPAIEGPGLRGARFFDPSDVDTLLKESA